ncbi:hypothetical protein K438DRAFT_1870786 [Mycena galopus ATCC 62051]|nr:hypothetical protein K438DRAFT_1870786 [Mycena galopus ATCC 62051]
MSFAGLEEDILVNILVLCDIYRVLTVSAINKPLRRLTQVKQLWLSLIQDSAFRQVLELHPANLAELESSSTEELVNLVRRAVTGPSLWWPVSPTPSLSRKITFDTHVQTHQDAHLLPGARYMLLGSEILADMYIYEVWSGRRVGKYAAKSLTHWAIDLVPGGDIARLLLAQPAEYVGGGCYVHVEEIDLVTGLSREVFNLSFTTRLKSLSGIVGDFFLYRLPWAYSTEVKMVLVNWRASTYVVLNYGTERNSDVILVRGYIIATHLESTPPHQQLLTVTSLDAFSPLWKPLSGISLSEQLSPPTIPITAQERLEHNGRPLGHVAIPARLSVVASALYDGAYNIVVFGGGFTPPPKPTTFASQMGNLISGRRQQPLTPEVVGSVLSYSFRPSYAQRNCQLRFVSAKRASPGFNPAGMFPQRAVVAQRGSPFNVSYYQ